MFISLMSGPLFNYFITKLQKGITRKQTQTTNTVLNTKQCFLKGLFFLVQLKCVYCTPVTLRVTLTLLLIKAAMHPVRGLNNLIRPCLSFYGKK